MKRLSAKILLSVLVSGMFAVTVLWSDPIPAVFRFTGTVLTGTIPIYAFDEADTSLTTDAQGWSNLAVEARFTLQTLAQDGNLTNYIAENGKWIVDDSWYETDKFPLDFPSFQSGKINLPLLTDVPNQDFRTALLNACFQIKNGSSGSRQCVASSWMLRKTQVNVTLSGTSLKTASVRFSSGVNLGQAVLKNPEINQRASFDLSVSKDSMPAAFAIYPDLTSANLPNTSLEGVKVSVYELKSNGTPHSRPVFVIVNGKSEMIDHFSMGAEFLATPSALQAKMNEIIHEAGIDRLTQSEKFALLENTARNEFFTTKLNETKVSEAEQMLREWSAKLIATISVPFGTGSTQGKWMAGIWRPTATSYRVVIETAAGVKPFGLFANLIPYDMDSANPSIAPVNTFLVNERELPWATTALKSQLGNNFQLNGWPTSVDELSPECRAMVESGPAKAYASGVFGALAAGAVGKIVGSMGGMLGISTQTLTHTGEIAGWLSSAVFDGLSVIDAAKFQLAYYASNAFAWNIRQVTAVKHPDKAVYCVGKPLLVDSVWYNQCGQPLWGAGAQNSSMYGMSPAEIATVEMIGPVQATTLPLIVTAIDSGMGARYRITGLKPGKLSMIFKVTGTNQTTDLEINFKKCTSKELEQY